MHANKPTVEPTLQPPLSAVVTASEPLLALPVGSTSESTAKPSVAFVDLALYGIAAAVAVIAPLFLVQLGIQQSVPFIRLMDEIYHPIVLLQIFTFTASAMLSGVLLWKVWGKNGAALRRELPLLLGILVSFHFLTMMRHHEARSWDYSCYERAAQAIVAGGNPYGDCYIYVPTPAQALAGIERLGAWSISQFELTALNSPQARWDFVFYLYEVTQFLLVIVAFFLCFRLAVTLGIERLKAAVIVTVLFLLNNPLLATLAHNQINLWVLNLMVAAMLWLPHRPFVSGVLAALGGHIKLYPLVLLLPWGLQRRWTAIAGTVIGLLGIFLLQTGGGRHLQLWTHFLSFADSFPRGTFFRDNSLHSLVYNTLGHLKWFLRDGDYIVNERYISLVVLAGMTGFGLLYLLRFVQREYAGQQKYTKMDTGVDTGVMAGQDSILGVHRRLPLRDVIQLGHSFDAIMLALIVSPVVWEHHYLLTMPVFIGALAWAKSERQLWMIGISAFSIFALPTFDLFPFSYHRLAGLLLLAVTVAPAMALPFWSLVEARRVPPLSTAGKSGYEQA